MMKISDLFIFVLALGAASGANQPALAYLDPGTGSMILQLFLGGLVGLAAVGKLYWHRLKGLFGRAPKAEAESSHEQANRT